jgi:anti-anti-sigma regulatory factor
MLSWLLDIQTQDDDILVVRRGRSLALLLLVLMGFSLLLAGVTPLVSGNLAGLISSGIAIVLFLAVYLINRSGRLTLATAILLTGFCLIQINAAILNRAPLPAIFFPCLIVVIAAAFGSPRAPLIWAAIATAIPFVINLALYRSIVPPAGQIVLADGTGAPPLLAMDVIVVVIFWMLAGISWFASRQLYQTIAESRAATQAAVTAQQEIAAQQADLGSRNAELTQVRQELELLVSELTVPVVPVADQIGLLPLVGSLDAARAARVEEDALKIVAERRLQALVIDLSGVSGLRPANVEGLVRLCSTLQLLGVTPVLAGLGAQGALLLSESQAVLPPTVATVQDALALLQNNERVNRQAPITWR